MNSKKKINSLKNGGWVSLALFFAFFGGYFVGLQNEDKTAWIPLEEENAIALYFSPRGGATDAIVASIEGAQSRILVQAYSFTSKPIAEALIAAHDRGVHVLVIGDKSQRNGRGVQYPQLSAHGIPIWIDKPPGLAHNKIIIIDDDRVLTGSFNFSQAAEYRNTENLVALLSKVVNKRYEEEFYIRLKKSKRY